MNILVNSNIIVRILAKGLWYPADSIIPEKTQPFEFCGQSVPGIGIVVVAVFFNQIPRISPGGDCINAAVCSAWPFFNCRDLFIEVFAYQVDNNVAVHEKSFSKDKFMNFVPGSVINDIQRQLVIQAC